MQEAKEEIRARLPVEEVVGWYIELRRAGKNLKALSPFTNEKTPSFMVSPDRGVWHDYSSGKGGDIFSFVMEMEGLTFPEAVKLLADKSGVVLAQYDSGADRDLADKRKKLYAALELAEKYYQFTLSKNQAVLDYAFYRRNLNRATLREFRLGYAPSAGDALVKFLASKKIAKETMEAAGLLNRRGTDLFRGRLMIPLMDANGRTIGFTGRILDDKIKDAPKYLNTPETLLYHKSQHVFGLSQAKKALVSSGFAVLVEGNMDVISSHQAGVPEAVATAGTAMTPDHLKSLARWTKDIRLAYDNDAAGLRAAERAVELASTLGIKLSVIAGYPAKDPDELIQKGADLWQTAVARPQPAVEWLFQEYAKRFNLQTGSGKREFSDAAAVVIRTIKDDIEQASYQALVAKMLAVDRELVAQKVASIASPKKRFRRANPEQVAARELLHDNLLGLVLASSAAGIAALLPSEAIRVSADSPSRPSSRGSVARGSLPLSRSAAEAPIARALLDEAEKLDYTRKQELILRAEGRYAGWSQQELQDEFRSLLAREEKSAQLAHKAELEQLLAEAEAEGDDEAVMELVTALNQINKG